MSSGLEARFAAGLREFELELELAVEPGTCLALVGPSGAGKSTALRAIAGLHRPDRGSVALGERRWLDRAQGVDLPPERRDCGYLFQDYALFPHLSAWRNVAFGLKEVPRRERRERATEVLAAIRSRGARRRGAARALRRRAPAGGAGAGARSRPGRC